MARRFRVLELDIDIQFFFVDISQDLLVVTHGDTIQFRSFTTGAIHARMVQRADGTYTTSVEGIPGEREHLYIYVDGDWLLADRMEAATPEAYQYMWHWPSGKRFEVRFRTCVKSSI